ncbi:M28 family metallopeptidase [Pontibacter harenae]|uniref:M28 family metallopeptidase n=1 Tax=Pontibacter harenae TaxID=2894083 RepID=UPI001E5B125E|nr:M28 family peptidase [Pontibacter harenae]MCC9166663.1 M28 family peptidase [Pontibacter harenae]
MKQTLLFFLFLLYLILPNAKAQDMQRVRQTIDTLTSPAMHGRGYIFEGDTKAANYIQDRFKEVGLQSFGNSYFQHFTLPVNRVVETPQLQVEGKALMAGKDFVANAATASGTGTLKVIYLDSIVYSNAKAAEKFFAQNLKSKAVVYRQQDRQRLNNLPAAHLQQLQQAGLHIVLQPKELLTTVATSQPQVPVLEVKASAWPKGAKKIKYSISTDFEPNYKTQNVIGFVKGTTQPDSFLVFSAHYDHLGGQGKDVYFPGANDNASGTAMLLELAQHYSQPQNRPKYSIALIAFAAEEAGLLGSFHYLQHPLFPLQQIKFLVNLDLLGTGDDGMMVVNGSIHPKQFQLLQSINQQQKYLPQIRQRGKAANSDHYPFSEMGVPAFFFYTLGGTAAYHNPQDFAAQLPLTRFPEVHKLILDFAEALHQ